MIRFFNIMSNQHGNLINQCAFSGNIHPHLVELGNSTGWGSQISHFKES